MGKNIVNEVREALVAKGWLKLHAVAVFKKSMSVYGIADEVFEFEGNFTQSQLPAATVKTTKEQDYEKRMVLGGDLLTQAQARRLFGDEFGRLQQQVTDLNEMWKEHPLRIGTTLFTSASRKFNDSSLTRGGRFFGGWSNIPEPERLTGTIDGDPVSEIDLRAANLTILTGLLKYPMPENPFSDPYAYVDADRKQTKDALLEILGAGDHEKSKGSSKYVGKHGGGTFKPVRDKLVDAYPVLEHLEKGKLDSNSLAYDESEIVLSAMMALREKGVVSYPMHDALICKARDEEEVVKALQKAFHDRVGIFPALTIQTKDEEERVIEGRQ